ncbi:MAG: hypothetical protein A4E30_01263 [Methanomassiliicoccales archaeon PtaB.Bin215]|nr:MAG: hypothetical protein A4E30_01263 [Methanomassiliicoccales archaeon PtaB.Bin215]
MVVLSGVLLTKTDSAASSNESPRGAMSVTFLSLNSGSAYIAICSG